MHEINNYTISHEMAETIIIFKISHSLLNYSYLIMENKCTRFIAFFAHSTQNTVYEWFKC